MDKSEIIAEITAFYTVVGTEKETPSSDTNVPSNVKYYSIIVFETGESEANKKPVLRSKYISFIVVDEGEVSEEAYYSDNELTNEVDSDITSTGSLTDIHKMYASDQMRGRVQAAIAKAAQDVLNEAVPIADLQYDANSGQKEVIVDTGMGAIFWVGKTVIIADDNNYEENTIIAINGDYLTMSTDLSNTYTVSNNGYVRFVDNVERQQWAANALLNPDAYTLSMTSLVSLNAAIQSAGGLATDNDIQFVVNSYINKVAAASYL